MSTGTTCSLIHKSASYVRIWAYLPNILAKEKEIWRKRDATNEKRATR